MVYLRKGGRSTWKQLEIWNVIELVSLPAQEEEEEEEEEEAERFLFPRRKKKNVFSKVRSKIYQKFKS